MLILNNDQTIVFFKIFSHRWFFDFVNLVNRWSNETREESDEWKWSKSEYFVCIRSLLVEIMRVR